jgi:hypothetical protein
MHDRCRGVHRVAPVRKADSGDAAQGAGLGRLQRQDQTPPGARGVAPLVRSHPVPPPQHQARFPTRRTDQDGGSGRFLFLLLSLCDFTFHFFRFNLKFVFVCMFVDDKSGGDLYSGGLQHAPARHYL